MGCIYRPPNGDISQFFEVMNGIMSALLIDSSYELILCGDFNVNLLDFNSDQNSSNFLTLMTSYSFIPLITKPSRINDLTGVHTLLDNIFCRNPVSYKSGTIVSSLSDHYPVFSVHRDFFSDSTNLNNNPIIIRYRSCAGENIESLCSQLSRHEFSPIMEMDDVDDAFVEFERVIMQYYNEHCPIITKSISYKDFSKPWIDSEIKNMIKKKNNYLKLVRSGRMTHGAYSRYRNFVTKKIRMNKKMYFESKFENVRGDMRRTWSLINSTIKPDGRNSRGGVRKLNMDGNVISHPIEIADKLLGN